MRLAGELLAAEPEGRRVALDAAWRGSGARGARRPSPTARLRSGWKHRVQTPVAPVEVDAAARVAPPERGVGVDEADAETRRWR